MLNPRAACTLPATVRIVLSLNSVALTLGDLPPLVLRFVRLQLDKDVEVNGIICFEMLALPVDGLGRTSKL